MSAIAARLAALGLALPPQVLAPPGVVLPFRPVRIVGTRAVVSGHGPQRADGSVIGHPGLKVGDGVSEADAIEAAKLTALSILGSLERTLGDLDRITGWTRLFGMVNAAPGYARHPVIINGCSDLIIELFGPDVGAHARSAIGVGSLPFHMPVEIEGEVEIRP